MRQFNAVASGGTLSHLAILDNFCWCSSYDKTRLAELVDAVRACYDYALGYETPFISGKDSMFNDFKGYDEKGNPVAISIPPTLLISAIGVMNDFKKSVSPEFKMAGDVMYVLGRLTMSSERANTINILRKGRTLSVSIPRKWIGRRIKKDTSGA